MVFIALCAIIISAKIKKFVFGLQCLLNKSVAVVCVEFFEGVALNFIF